MPKPNNDRSDTPQRAREQADAYDSVFSPHTLNLGDGNTIEIPPHPNLRMLDDDRQQEYEQLLFEVEETYDREPDIYHPEQHLENGIIIPSSTQRGALRVPYRITGEDGKTHLVQPPHSVKVVQIALGEDGWKKLKAAGKSAADVWRIWNRQGVEVALRENFRPAVNGSAGNLAQLSR